MPDYQFQKKKSKLKIFGKGAKYVFFPNIDVLNAVLLLNEFFALVSPFSENLSLDLVFRHF
jgi:hypothetical protein